MTEPVNINTATFLQLKSLKGIGEAKANAILRAREEKGTLTEDNIFDITEISSTLWASLLKDNLITFKEVKPSGEDLASKVALLRDKISSIEKDRSDMVVSFQLQADQMREKNLAILEQQRLQYEQERDEYLQKVKQELNHFREMVETKDKELDRYHGKTEKMQSQIEQQESLARIQKVITDRESKSGVNYKPPSTPDKYGPSAPKLAIFDGKSDWRPYFLQFSTIADRYKWTDEQRLFKLIELLRDRALKYYSNRVKSLQANYKLFCQKFNEKFGKKELPHILRRLLQDLRQENEENLRDFAERAQELAVDGYPDTPEKFAETLATDAFLRGCLDKRAALVAMDKNPESLDQAVQFVRSAAANQKVIMGGKKSEVKRVTFSDTEDVQEQEEETFAVRVVEKDDDKRGVSASIEKRIKKTEDDLAETKIIVKKILNILNQNQGQNQRSRSTYRSPTPERPTSPYRGTGCFHCGKEGHFARDCPSKIMYRNGSPMRSRSPSPSHNTLNYQGSRKTANS
ncbi:unnamed protein product [Mytilus edulis]|uniref:CCHC-type domain-containing protein n=1 Tax=Mytilus edulis TaxID=6550 RepID=A0A8S3QS06_MYTED|nr:unnamed protein product [Mytilus edulis]